MAPVSSPFATPRTHPGAGAGGRRHARLAHAEPERHLPELADRQLPSVAFTPTILPMSSEAPVRGVAQWWYGWPATMQAAR